LSSGIVELSTPAWGALDFLPEEVGTVEELRARPWAKAGVATVERTRIGVRLRFGGFVGRIHLPGHTINIDELVPGTAQALASFVAEGRRWSDEWADAGTIRVPAWTQLASLYCAHLEKYVAAGIDKQYRGEYWVTGRPRGRIDVAATLARQWARGRTQLLVCRPRVLTEDTTVNRALYAAAMRADGLLRLANSHDVDLASLRRCLRAFSNVTSEVFPDLRAAVHHATGDATTERLVGLAELLIQGVGVFPSDASQRQPMDVWFNAAWLFEKAILRLASEIAGPSAARQGKGDGVSLLERDDFGSGGFVRMDADPDVVIGGGAGTAILDAKYRREGFEADRGQLYQLIAHATAYRARAAALVAPAMDAASTPITLLGRDSAGRRYFVLRVDAKSPERMRSILQTWLRMNGMLSVPSVRAS